MTQQPEWVWVRVWLAGESGLRRILTVDRADFSAFRIKGGKRFELIDWM